MLKIILSWPLARAVQGQIDQDGDCRHSYRRGGCGKRQPARASFCRRRDLDRDAVAARLPSLMLCRLAAGDHLALAAAGAAAFDVAKFREGAEDAKFLLPRATRLRAGGQAAIAQAVGNLLGGGAD